MSSVTRQRKLGAARGRGGFTLVEILAAVMLLSIGLLAVMTASRAARETQKRALYTSIARNTAQSEIEKLRAVSFAVLPSMSSSSSSSSLPPGNTVTVVVAPYPTVAEKNLYKATATVTWPHSGGNCSVRYETLIARK